MLLKGESMDRSLLNFDLKKHVLIQTIPIIAYLILLLILWDDIPECFAIHFNFEGLPDNYVNKVVGTIGIPLTIMLTVLILTNISYKYPLWRSQISTLIQYLLALTFSLTLLFNVGMVSRMVVLFCAITGTIAIIFKVFLKALKIK